jgi:hypothetical protein
MSCKKSDDTLTKVFNKTELKTIEKIIKYYDDYVISQTDNQLSIDKAYIAFLDKKASLVKSASDFNLFLPDKNERIKFYKTLDKNVLSEIYDIRDTLTIHFRGEDEARQFYSPFSFSLNYDGKYAFFLKELSLKSEFYKNYYELIKIAGDISPVNYAMILHDYNKIDFNKKEERLVLIINLLQTGETIKLDK